MRSAVMSLLCAGVISAWAAVASADLPPPEDYVETCTADQQQHEGTSCVECPNWYEHPAMCAEQYGSQGYTQACRSYGASAWTEVWCTTNAATGTGSGTGEGSGMESQVPAEHPQTASTPAPYLATGGALILVVMALSVRRRSPR